MPDVDGGHGFLTALLPLNIAPCKRSDGTVTSPAHAVRELLSTLPTAQHSLACAKSGLQSPFARSLTTHFIRFAVIDAPAFNGRDTRDAILTAAHVGPDLMQAPTADVLSRPYLLFCADFDVEHGAPMDVVRAYLRDLCAKTPEVWSALLAHCKDFEAHKATDYAADYILDCRVETTMPFNDYAVGAAAKPGVPAIVLPVGLGLLAGLIVGFFVFRLTPAAHVVFRWCAALLAWSLVAALASVALMNVFGRRSAPWAPGADLRTVLKALRLQADFASFALAHQGDAATDLQAAFKAFLKVSRPADLDGPTQSAGVVP